MNQLLPYFSPRVDVVFYIWRWMAEAEIQPAIIKIYVRSTNALLCYNPDHPLAGASSDVG
jgi:hypothetical protein